MNEPRAYAESKLKPMPSDWLRRLRKKGYTKRTVFNGSDPRLNDLKKMLLRRDGYAVVLPRIEDDLDALLSRGQWFNGRGSILHKGAACQCHSNAARLFWNDQRNILRIATGYAMTNDGIWNQHSWVMMDHKVIETTTRRLIYFGVVFNQRESMAFCEDNCF